MARAWFETIVEHNTIEGSTEVATVSTVRHPVHTPRPVPPAPRLPGRTAFMVGTVISWLTFLTGAAVAIWGAVSASKQIGGAGALIVVVATVFAVYTASVLQPPARCPCPEHKGPNALDHDR